MKKKLPKNINSNVIVEHFLSGVVLQSFMPITLTGFEKNNLLTERESYYQLTPHKLSNGKSKVSGDVLDTELKTPSFYLYFKTFIIFPVEILQEMHENVDANRPDWWMDDASALKKSMAVDERLINREISKLQSANALAPNFFVGIGESLASKQSGIIIPPKTKEFIINKTINFVGENKINKPLVYKYEAEVTISSTGTQPFTTRESFWKTALQYASVLDSLLFADKTYYTFAQSKPPKSIYVAIQGAGENDNEI